MATVQQASPDRWVVHLGSQEDSEVAIEVHMSRKAAKRIADLETQRIAQLNPGRTDIDPQTIGLAVCSVLGLFAANGHVS